MLEALTVARWAKRWRDDRAKLGKDAKHEYARLEHHVLPWLGDRLLANARTPIVIELFARIRTTPSKDTGKPLSPRTVHHIYSTFMLMMRDAELAGLIEHAPAPLDDRHLGRKTDADPEWRASALFTRDEVQTLISTSKIPWDRRVAYAIELLAGTRPGEAAALRWRHYDPTKRPLGELLVAKSYNAKRQLEKGTKTLATRHIPVHPTLATILDEWRSGWEQMMGRAPEPDDLIVPMPPDDAAARTSARKDGEAFRADYYARRRWVDEDLPALGWRHRRHYDTRATFVTLALEDGADRHVIETRVTHTKPTRSAFDFYNRGLQWKLTCAEVAKLKIERVRDSHDHVIAMSTAANRSLASSRDSKRLQEPFGPVLVQSTKTAAIASTSGLPTRLGSRTVSIASKWSKTSLRPGKPSTKAPARRHRGDDYRAMLGDDPKLTRADLARRLGISRAAVTQALRRPKP